MVSRRLFGAAVAVGLTTLAAAHELGNAANNGVQIVDVVSSSTDSVNDNVAHFLTVVAAVPADKYSYEVFASDRPDIDQDDENRTQIERHLGLGFAHGMRLSSGRSNLNDVNCNDHRDCGESSPAD